MRSVDLCVGACLVCIAQIAFAANPESAARLAEMTKRVKAIQLAGENAKGLEVVAKPLLRFSDPTRKMEDASLWRLGKTGRPKAILILEKYQETTVPAYEVSITSNDPPERIIGPRWTVRTKPDQIEWADIRNAPKPSTNPRLRKTQMKQILRKFKVSETFEGQTYQLRMLPKALVEYDDKQAGISAGAIFVFSHGTNAELMLMAEVHKREDQPERWRVATARVGGASFEVEYDGKPFRSIPRWLGDSGTYFYFGGY